MTKNKFRRYLKRAVTEDLSEKMVFIGGPRQAGKTTFALGFLEDGAKDEANPAYLNWNCAFCAT